MVVVGDIENKKSFLVSLKEEFMGFRDSYGMVERKIWRWFLNVLLGRERIFSNVGISYKESIENSVFLC